tara:strand:+ start:44 stop:802 length:759 start_codon:yes stop_codon:yes gene_type:complete
MTSRLGRRYFIYKFTDEELKTIEECCSDVEKKKNEYNAKYFNRSDKKTVNEKFIDKGAIWGSPDAKPDPYRASDIYSICNDSILESLLMEKAQLANKEAFWNVDINRVQKPQYSDYPEGGHYDWHTDQFLMPVNQEVRKISMSLFLNDPDEYEGGELDLEVFGPAKDHNEETRTYKSFHGIPPDNCPVPVGRDGKPIIKYIPTEEENDRYVSFKYEKGVAVFFQSCDWHRVRPVTSGKRTTLVGWFAGPPYV